jgi:hypothetical protein
VLARLGGRTIVEWWPCPSSAPRPR